jgi:hypothetical protein
MTIRTMRMTTMRMKRRMTRTMRNGMNKLKLAFISVVFNQTPH